MTRRVRDPAIVIGDLVKQRPMPVHGKSVPFIVCVSRLRLRSHDAEDCIVEAGATWMAAILTHRSQSLPPPLLFRCRHRCTTRSGRLGFCFPQSRSFCALTLFSSPATSHLVLLWNNLVCLPVNGNIENISTSVTRESLAWMLASRTLLSTTLVDRLRSCLAVNHCLLLRPRGPSWPSSPVCCLD